MKPDENKTGFDSMLRRGLSTDPAPGARNCPEPDTLAAYYERSLAPGEVQQLEKHLSSCVRCRAQIAALVRSEPAVEAHPSSVRSWLWHWRWLAPVVAATAIVLVWVSVHEHNKVATQNALEALNSAAAQPEELTPAAPATQSGVPSPRLVEPGPVAAPNRKETNRQLARPAMPSSGFVSGQSETEMRSLQESETQIQPSAPAAKVAPLPKTREEGAPTTEGEAVGSAGGGVAGGVIGGVVSAQPSPPPEDKALTTTLAQSAPAGDAAASKEKATRIASPKSASGNAGMTNRRYAMSAKKAVAAPNSATDQIRVLDTVLSPVLIATPDATKIWRVDVSGAIQLSSDSGQTWVTQTDVQAGQIKSGFAPSAKVCWIVGREGVVLRTVNGKDWKQISSPTSEDLTSVYASSAKRAQVTAADSSVYITKDGGKSWTRQNTP
jgi:hypothetical protein